MLTPVVLPSSVDLGVFKNDEFKWLSPVMFSSCATWGKVRALSADPNPNIIFEAVKYNPNGTQPHIVKAKKANYTERLLDGLRVYHNPLAAHPLDRAVFRHSEFFRAIIPRTETIGFANSGTAFFFSGGSTPVFAAHWIASPLHATRADRRKPSNCRRRSPRSQYED
jgi:hypothetical protein